MTDAEVQEIAAELFARWKNHPQKAVPDFRTDHRNWLISQDQQKRLAAELGRRMGGWRWTDQDFPAHRLNGRRNPHSRALIYQRHDLPPHHDHGSGYRLNRKAIATVSQPYGFDDTMEAEMRVWASTHGLVFLKPDFPSWWLPTKTTLVLFVRPNALSGGDQP